MIDLNNIKAEILENINRFAYTGQLKLKRSDVISTLEASKYLSMDQAITLCVQFIKKNLTVFNVLGHYYYAKRMMYYQLLKVTKHFVYQNFNEMVKYPKESNFLNLGIGDLLKVLSRSELEVDGEMNVFAAVEVWVNHSNTRKKFMNDLLDKV